MNQEQKIKQPQGGALTDEQIREIAVDYCRFVFPGVYSIKEFDCEEDFFNCVRAILAAPAATVKENLNVAARPAAGDGLRRDQEAAYNSIDRFLRNNLCDEDYAQYSAELDSLLTAPRQPGEMGAGVPADGVRWDLFPAWLIDHCEGETITEEGLQSALADMLKVYPATKATSAQQDEREVWRFNEDAERSAFEDVIRSLTDPKNHHDDLARDEYAHDDYVRWPTALAWEAWKARAIQVQADAWAVAGHFVKRSMFGPWIEIDPAKEPGTPLYTRPAGKA